MTQMVYCVFDDHDYDGQELISIYSTKGSAEACVRV